MHSSAFSHCVNESDSSRLFCSICRSNCGQMLLHFGILTGSRTVCLSAAYASTVCLCSRVRSFSKKVVRAGTPILQPCQKELQALLVYILATVCTCMKKFLGSALWQQFALCALAAYVRDPRLEYVCFPNCH